MQFDDVETPEYLDFSSASYEDTFDQGYTPASNLGEFLSRPVRISQFSWNVGASLNQVINPWTLFFTNPNVAQKLAHFFLLRSKLHVKFVINGTPFHYGRVLVSYEALHTQNQLELETGITLFPSEKLVFKSQRPHIFLDPTTCEGGEMVLPYFFPQNWLRINDNIWDQMGELSLDSFVPLAQASTNSSEVSITVLAWATDVKVSIPTTLQAKDEYGKGVISSTASSVANIAKEFKKVSYIRPFARSTEIAAGAVRDIARIFGFSRPAVLENTRNVRPWYVGQLAVCDADENLAKLSLDSKQELTIDPRTTGLEGVDELDIRSIVTRKSFLDNFSWNDTQPIETLLWNSRVNPALSRQNVTVFVPTPMAHLSQLFNYWTGDIIFSFQVIASEYHRGRLRITVDPSFYTPSPDNFNTITSRIVDISEMRDFEICVSWMQSTAYCIVPAASPDFDTLPIVTPNVVFNNGVITVEVLNQLATPDSVNGGAISLNVYVRGGENLEFMNPTGHRLKNMAYKQILGGPALSLQARNDSTPCPDTGLVCAGDDRVPNDRSLVYGGEKIVSVRQILKRYCMHRASDVDDASGTKLNMHRLYFRNFPSYRGTDPTSFENFALTPYCMVTTTHLNYITPAFLGWRGAIRYKYVLDVDDPQKFSVTMERRTNDITTLEDVVTLTDPETFARASGELFAGAYMTPISNNPTLECELPFYSRFRFAYARGITENPSSRDDDSLFMTHRLNILGEGNIGSTAYIYTQLVSVGEDFNLFYYQNAPPFYAL